MRFFCFTWLLVLFSFDTVATSDFEVKLVDVNNEPLTDMVVFLQPLDDVVLPVNNKVVEIGQLDRAFTPYISVMQLGSAATFQNQDDITHHIYSPVGENKFSFKIRAGQSQIKNDFQQLGEVAMGCNIHDWMSGYLYIVDTPLFGKTNNQGIASIVMPHEGKYRLVVWHPQMKVEGHSVSKTLTWPTSQQFTFKVPHKIAKISKQENEEDFDFLSDY